ncbi:MAG: protein kinase [Deltaproteobacteria bacterium]|nr:protein kinase [Deltaproteobacteria bacterium]
MHPSERIAGRFGIERLAGEGGMGTVYRALDRQSGEPVALKILRSQDVGDVERFGREARVLAELRHPGIVRYIDHGRTPRGDLYLAMEWLEGEGLDDRLAAVSEENPGSGPATAQAPSKLTLAESVTLIRTVGEALAEAHGRGIVHRDIKPSNLFLVGGQVERAKILDFGIARQNDGPGRTTRTGMILGTPGYMAPEQAQGASAVDARADVFSLGCVLFECITGRPAFVGEGVLALLAKILLEDVPRMSEVVAEVPPALDGLVARMVSKDVRARPHNARALVTELATIDLSFFRRRLSRIERAVAITDYEQRLLSVVLSRAQDTPASSPQAMTVPGMADGSLQVMQRLAEVAAAHGGRLFPLANGSVVASLTSSGTATDQAAQAARLALAMRSVLPHAPMALATGRGEVSGRSLVGEAIDRAARLLRTRGGMVSKGQAGAGQRPIWLDEVTAGLLDVRFELGGDSDCLELIGERELVEKARTLLGRPTPCVGRERELRTLASIFEECQAEPSARCVLVTAPAGTGKTRLRQELVRMLRQRPRGTEIWIGRGDPMTKGSPFGLLAPAMRRACGVVGGEPLAIRRQKLRARLSRHVSATELPRIAEFVGELTGVPFPEEESVQLRAARRDAMLMADQMRRAWEDWLAAELGVAPLVILLEDLHWGDVPTVKFIDAALRNHHDKPLLVLALARPEVHEEFPELWADRGVHEIRLTALAPKASEKLARHVLGNFVEPELVVRIVEQAGGNAFYLEELIRAVAEGKGDSLPETVLAMVQGRLESLPAEARRVLRAASILGQVFWRGGVQALLGGKSQHVEQWLAHLCERELIMRREEFKFPGEETWVFRHSLVREAAHAMLTDSDRTLGHRLAGEWLVRVGERDARVLAEHFERGGDPRRAIEFYGRAAEQALGGNDLAAVLSLVTRARSLGAQGEVLGALCLAEAEARRWRGENALAERAGIEALELLHRGSGRWYAAAGELALTSGRLGNHERIVSLAQELLSLGKARADGAHVIAAVRAALHLFHGGRYELAERLVAETERLVMGDFTTTEPSVRAWVHRVRATRALFSGDLGVYLHETEAAALCFDVAGDIRNTCQQRASVGYACMKVGLYAEAEVALSDALATAGRTGLHNVTNYAKHNLGLVLSLRGCLEEARVVEAEAVAAFLAQGDRRMEGASRTYLATIRAMAGEREEAAREAACAVDILTASPPLRAHALATLAQIELMDGNDAQALEAAREAMHLLETLGKIDEGDALVRLVYAEALQATGAVEGARAAIAAARDRLVAQAALVTDPALRESLLTRVPEHAHTLSLARAWVRS